MATKRAKFNAMLAEKNWTAVGAAEWEQLRAVFAESSLREWLRGTGLRVDQPYRGVETKTLALLEDSLAAMADLYQRDQASRKTCRATVIAAKDRARFASRNQKVDPKKRALKAEMVEWMLVWLDDPGMFSTWAALRQKTLTPSSEQAPV
jgi:predicted aminopeptidase